MSEKNNFLAIASIVNGLVSGSLLVLPIQSLNAGWLTTVVLSLMIGIIECYTSYLIILHGKEHISVYHSVMAHFGGSKTMGGLYNLAVVVSLVWTCVAEFSFLIEQIEGFIPEQTWVGVVVFLGLVLACWAENYLHMSEKIMGMGIFTIFSLCAFIIWAILTTHSGSKKLPMVGENSFDIASGFMMAYSCHQFMLFVLMRTTQKEDYVKVSVQSFAWGIFAYTLISLGSFAIINRESRSEYAETFQDFFPYGNWQVTLLEGIYFFHILTILPQMTIIIKIRFLQLFNIDEELQNQSDASSDSQEGQLQTQHHKLRDFLCFFAIIGVCFLVWVLNMKISVIVEINGTVTSMFTIFIFPLLVHFKCVLWDGHYQISTCEEVCPDLLKKNNPCSVVYKTPLTKWLQLGTLTLILAGALFMAAQTLYATFFSPQQTL